MKTLLKLLLAIMIMLVISTLSVSNVKLDGIELVKGAKQDIEIQFDAAQRPFVYADSLDDALFAEGYLHAANRLWQMEMFRRAGSGRLSELFGKDMIATDIELWRLGIPKLAQKLQANASDVMQQRVQDYISGINNFIYANPILPPELLLLGSKVSPWQAEDVYAVGALMAFQSGNNFRNELLRMAIYNEVQPELARMFLTHDGNKQEFPYVMPLPAANHNIVDTVARLDNTDANENHLMPRFAFGSNGWVVSPEKTENKRALFAFDSHDALGLPNLFYEVHLFFNLNNQPRQIRGWSVAGLPGVINGFNEHIAWGFTNIGDTQDVFVETPHPEQAFTYKDGETWYKADTEQVSIKVKGEQKPTKVTLVNTLNGVLIAENPSLSLRWTIQDIGDKGLDAILQFNLARDWQEFNKALDQLAAPSLNATYADTKGNIGFRTAGVLPLRGEGVGLVPLAGDIAENRWQGMVNERDMPRIYNPKAGFIAAANARVNAEGQGVLVSADNAAPYRIQRIQSVLQDKQQLTLTDMQTLQVDYFDTQAQLLLPTMLADLTPSRSTAHIGAQRLLKRWLEQPIADKNSGAALVFQLWYKQLANDLLASRLPKPLLNKVLKKSYLVNHTLDQLLLSETEHLWWQDKRKKFISDAFTKAVKSLVKTQGQDPLKWRLGNMHTVKLNHELGKAISVLDPMFNSDSQPMSGSTSTVGRANYDYLGDLKVKHGATVRVIAEMTDDITVKSIMPGGQNGHPMSAHYDDQFTSWLNGKLTVIEEPQQQASMSLLLKAYN
ncbi:penicillin acylase family protein [Thalassotalea sp. Y01]|uniref:penicillin acylase family protein n=1 Tax=Thalassotalea sp. Y01 TaxID=2729613 RepID=UPI00145EBCA4|nr:penicillin acylase family protein [Thalassotalea sp. Y01]NMP16048.1 penicillin acylase family protein [Thalassotalea sp. Y01]